MKVYNIHKLHSCSKSLPIYHPESERGRFWLWDRNISKFWQVRGVLLTRSVVYGVYTSIREEDL